MKAATVPWHPGAVISAVQDSELPGGVKITMLALITLADDHGYTSPGRRALGRYTGLPPSTAWNHMQQLARAGWLHRCGRSAPKGPVGGSVIWRIDVPARAAIS